MLSNMRTGDWPDSEDDSCRSSPTFPDQCCTITGAFPLHLPQCEIETGGGLTCCNMRIPYRAAKTAYSTHFHIPYCSSAFHPYLCSPVLVLHYFPSSIDCILYHHIVKDSDLLPTPAPAKQAGSKLPSSLLHQPIGSILSYSTIRILPQEV